MHTGRGPGNPSRAVSVLENRLMSIRRISSVKDAAGLRQFAAALGVEIPADDAVIPAPDGPLARPYPRASGVIGNRFCILPMEGWDGTEDGRPSDLTRRRWRHFGLSGAKLIWGGEAVAVRHDGRANPNQLLINDANLAEIADLRTILLDAHREHFGTTDDLLVGLQLTHSGRFSRPNEKRRPEPRVAYRHPVLDPFVGVKDDSPVLSDDDVARLVDDFARAARLAQKAGYAFIDVKHCHGYLGHEFLSAVDRPGRYGGTLENRTRFLREVVEAVRAEAPGLEVGVRVSVLDFVPFRASGDGTGEPCATSGRYPYAFGGDGTGVGIDLTEPSEFFGVLERLGIDLVCTTAGSPYYTPHVIRPAAFPPSDGYLPPEDPLIGVARHLRATAELKARHPRLTVVGSGYTYLQEWLAHVGQRVIRDGGADFIGLGRMVLSYPEMPADVLAGRPTARKRFCRTFSECTTAPRNGMVSGCYPLDPFYKERPERERVAQLKFEAKLRQSGAERG
jgi:2,4-dienoyl-CoA reductase-like NADH-dependent reductase (Old Yellow Enzyme family)